MEGILKGIGVVCVTALCVIMVLAFVHKTPSNVEYAEVDAIAETKNGAKVIFTIDNKTQEMRVFNEDIEVSDETKIELCSEKTWFERKAEEWFGAKGSLEVKRLYLSKEDYAKLFDMKMLEEE